MENAVQRANGGKKVRLSRQQITSCVKDGNYKWFDGSILKFGCCGGGCALAYTYAMDHGLVDESTYPYVNTENQEVRYFYFKF